MNKYIVSILAIPAMLLSMGLSANQPTSTVADTPLTGLIVSMQNAHFSDISQLTTYGVANNSITISGCYLYAGTNLSMSQYVAKTYDQIHDLLSKYVSSHSLSGTTDYVLLDLEAPLSPKYWGQQVTEDQDDDTTTFTQFVTALKIRIQVAKDIFPDAKIGLYGVATNRQYSSTSSSWIEQLSGFTTAAQLGAFDQLDYLAPVCYTRFCESDAHSYMTRIKDAAQLVIQAAQSFTKSDGSSLTVIPLITPNVYNGSSDCDKAIVPASEMWEQITWIRSFNIDTCLIWVPSATLPNTTETIPEYLDQILESANNSD